jgi:cytochrome P450
MTKAALSVSQDPKTPDFVQDPYRFYAAMHRASPVFFWEEYGMWCAAGYDQVNALLRDRRLGRENRWGRRSTRSKAANTSPISTGSKAVRFSNASLLPIRG